jgi:hypothetical protein
MPVRTNALRGVSAGAVMRPPSGSSKSLSCASAPWNPTDDMKLF